MSRLRMPFEVNPVFSGRTFLNPGPLTRSYLACSKLVARYSELSHGTR